MEGEHGTADGVFLMLCAAGLVVVAGFASGLTLAFFSLDLLELEVLRRAGNARQRTHAASLLALLGAGRHKHHQLLVALLFVNAACNEALPLVLDAVGLSAGASIIVSVVFVLIFGEVIPQAVCARHALGIAGRSVAIANVAMAITAPVSWPCALLLDWLLNLAGGHEAPEPELLGSACAPPALASSQAAPLTVGALCGIPEGFWGAGQPEWPALDLEPEGGWAEAPRAHLTPVTMHVQRHLHQAHEMAGGGVPDVEQPLLPQTSGRPQQQQQQQQQPGQRSAAAELVRVLSGRAAVEPGAASASGAGGHALHALRDALMDHAKLKALIQLHGRAEGLGGQLASDEVKVILGALDLRFKPAHAAMTPLRRALCLVADAPLSPDTLSLLLARGHSRVPVIRPTAAGLARRGAGAAAGGSSPEGAERGEDVACARVEALAAHGLSPDDVLGVLLVKELLTADFESGELCVGDVPLRPLPQVPATTSLLDLLILFQSCGSHMALLVEPRGQAAPGELAPSLSRARPPQRRSTKALAPAAQGTGAAHPRPRHALCPPASGEGARASPSGHPPASPCSPSLRSVRTPQQQRQQQRQQQQQQRQQQPGGAAAEEPDWVECRGVSPTSTSASSFPDVWGWKPQQRAALQATTTAAATITAGAVAPSPQQSAVSAAQAFYTPASHFSATSAPQLQLPGGELDGEGARQAAHRLLGSGAAEAGAWEDARSVRSAGTSTEWVDAAPEAASPQSSTGLWSALLAHHRAAGLAASGASGSDTPARSVVSAATAYTARTAPNLSYAVTPASSIASDDALPSSPSSSASGRSFCSDRPHSPRPTRHRHRRHHHHHNHHHHHLRFTPQGTPTPFLSLNDLAGLSEGGVCISIQGAVGAGTQESMEAPLTGSPHAADAPGPSHGSEWVVVGLITLEDVIEEMMQVEIIDETDEWIDNRQNVRVSTMRLLASLPALRGGRRALRGQLLRAG